jgi:hypothetical protein
MSPPDFRPGISRGREHSIPRSSVSSRSTNGLLYRCGNGSFALFVSAGAASGDHTQMGWEVADLRATVTALRVEFLEYDLPGFTTVDGIARIEGNYPSKGATGELGAWFRDSERATCTASASRCTETPDRLRRIRLCSQTGSIGSSLRSRRKRTRAARHA